MLLKLTPWFKSVFSQEGVSLGIYSPLEVSVETDDGVILCRTYQINNFYACPPSPQYKLVCAHSSTDQNKNHWQVDVIVASNNMLI